jgi:hypothetical protein
MPAAAHANAFRAPLFELGADTTESSAASLMGFCVAAHLASTTVTRAEWAERLDVSRGHLTAMAVTPTRSFVAIMDQALSELDSPQRLRPRLSGYHAEVSVDVEPDSPEHWLATYFELLDRQPWPIVDSLLRSEVVAARGRNPRPGDTLERSHAVYSSVHELLTIASGPYGGSLLATRRAAELGLLVPRPFFDLIEAHLFHSPVGFRVLRTLERFAQVWGKPSEQVVANNARNAAIEERLQHLLLRLAGAGNGESYVDPYPGGEWGVALAGERLSMRSANKAAHDWTRKVTLNVEKNLRERLYAAWTSLGHHKHRAIPMELVGALEEADSEMLRTWAVMLRIPLRDSAHQDRRFSEKYSDPKLMTAVAQNKYLLDLRSVVGRLTDASSASSTISEALSSILFSVLATPNGRLRRFLIEAITSAGQVRPAIEILLGVSHSFDDPFIQEAIVFCLSRFREPADEVIAHLLQEAVSCDKRIRQSAFWALGDVSSNTPSLQQPKIFDLLVSAAIPARLDTTQDVLVSKAAAYSLAINCVNVGTTAPFEHLQAHMVSPHRSAIIPDVQRLSDWGRQVTTTCPRALASTLTDSELSQMYSDGASESDAS